MTLPGWPRLMKARLAASYLDISETRFRELVSDGHISQPKESGGNVLWDIADLNDYADSLPKRAERASIRQVINL